MTRPESSPPCRRRSVRALRILPATNAAASSGLPSAAARCWRMRTATFFAGIPVAKPLNQPPAVNHRMGTPASKQTRSRELPTVTLPNTAMQGMPIQTPGGRLGTVLEQDHTATALGQPAAWAARVERRGGRVARHEAPRRSLCPLA